MNQRGEATLFGILTLVALSGLLTLSGLCLEYSFRTLQKRTKLFLCAKEVRGEVGQYLKFMGRTNWAIKNADRAKLIMLLIPGLQGGAMSADRLKRAIKLLQTVRLPAYLTKLGALKQQGCPLDPRIFLTPFQLGGLGYLRDEHDAAKLRSKEWDYHFLKSPYLLTLSFDARGLESPTPRPKVSTKERPVKLSSISF